jgi:hypothetical protein
VNQHEFIVDVLCAAGGRAVEDKLPAGYVGKRADVVFSSANLIVEVKSLTNNRRLDSRVTAKLSEVMAWNARLGVTVVPGANSVRLHDLPQPVAAQLLRVVGAPVRKETISARRQIVATRAALDLPDAYGLLVFVSPPEHIGSETMAWLINDAGKHSGSLDGLDGAMTIETPLGLDARRPLGNSFSSLWSISGRTLPEGWAERFAVAWERLTSQPGRSTELEQFVALGGTE